jgi:hypothetical protein
VQRVSFFLFLSDGRFALLAADVCKLVRLTAAKCANKLGHSGCDEDAEKSKAIKKIIKL